MNRIGAIIAALVLVLLHCSDGSTTSAKKRNQEVKKRSAASGPTAPFEDSQSKFELPAEKNIGVSVDGSLFTEAPDPDACPVCSARTFLADHAVAMFWSNDSPAAYACACNALKVNANDQLARAVLLTLRSARTISKDLAPDSKLPNRDPKPSLTSWEVLGPINVGKLELDGDPTFAHADFARHQGDVGSYLLAMDTHTAVHSDLVSESSIYWQKLSGKANGQVDLHFPVVWNDLVQGISNTAVYELQVWVRTTTFIKTPGAYVIDCQGPHTVYVRNENMTRVLVGDVYKAQQVRGTVDLKAGLVGIVLPMRAVVQSSFKCDLMRAPDSVMVYPPTNLPHLLEVPSLPGHGYVLSSVFTLTVHNPLNQAVTMEYGVEKPVGDKREWFIRETALHEDPNAAPRHTPIAPGQTLSLALELVQADIRDSILPPTLPCRDDRPFHVVVIPSKGQYSKVPFELKCRKISQSFHISFVDHDNSVSQAAVVVPIEVHSPDAAEIVRSLNSGTSTAAPKKGRGTRSTKPTDPPVVGNIAVIQENGNLLTAQDVSKLHGFPILLSLHGSGIPALNHADAHKIMLPGEKDYTFGVRGYYLLAPARFGAHNWETTGFLTANASMMALHKLSLLFPSLLPKLRLTESIISGHSMGGHGAWIAAVNIPDTFICAAPTSGWVKKEEYSNGNAFFDLDIASSFAEPTLKAVLEGALSEFHVDKLASNLLGSAVHIRVGTHDLTTHPWFSRRMHRVLKSIGVNTTIEESQAKQHWWWDTVSPNDGGVLNDNVMRAFYASCHARYVQQMNLHKMHLDYEELKQNGTVVGPFGDFMTSKPKHMNKEQVAEHISKQFELLNKQKCKDVGTLSVINPALHGGYCGAQILQQQHALVMSTVQMIMDSKKQMCKINTGNVRKLTISVVYGSVCYEASKLVVNKMPWDVPAGESTVEICIDGQRRPVICNNVPSPLLEKSLRTYGPVRHAYHRPFVIIYGTPLGQYLRLAMRDFAVFLANAHYAAHHTFVPVFSDLEYRSSGFHKFSSSLSNIIFIGDIHTNKLLRMLHQEAGSKNPTMPMQFRLPADLEFHGIVEVDENDEDDEDVPAPKSGFTLNNVTFDQQDHGVVFTMPIQRTQGSAVDSSMGVCIHANSAQGYLHLSRLSWPVIPPMVRAPLAAYIPDYVVLGKEIWAEGPGGILAAGFWDAEWNYDQVNGFVSSDYI